ncbi:hypothetical protein BASA81_008906 [Batrachochytrium salamandrivorans]|nr:hypothetical protein BASA81_008906 [Batrachochytrium salamandrivorans]
MSAAPAGQTKYEKLRSKHGGELQKLQANRDELKKKGNVKSWLEVFVLVNEDRQMFTQPVAQHLTKGESKHNLNPYVQIGLIVPPNAYQASSPKVSRPLAKSPPTSPVMRLYEQLPTPQNPKLVLANDRKAYDNALDAQLEAERSKLVYLQMAPDATNRQIQAQVALVEQLVQQQEMVQQQHAQNQANKQRVQQKKQREQAQVAAPVVAPPVATTLEDRIKAFFRNHEPEALTDGRVDAVLMWTQERGEDKLNAMLREQYGRDLLGQLNVDSTFVDQVQADRIARRLNGFYHAKQVHNMPESECQKIGEWACKAGEAALNAKLRAKYNDDLDSYAQSIMLQVEAKLRAFYLEKNPEMMRDKGLGPLLTWTVSNGIPALNQLLLEKYGEDLLGNKRDLFSEEKSERRLTTMTRSILYRDLHREPSMATIKMDGDGDDVLDNRKQMLIRQFATFLEVQDPKRLTQGGLVPLVQWALPRTDKQVDELLLETYGVDLDDAGLRDFDFSEREVNQFQGKQERDSMAYLAGKAASVVMEDEFNRAEIRSQRGFTQDDPLLAMPQMFEDEEPDF